MKTKLDKARQAFQERYGVTPQEKGFVFIEKEGAKIVFAKNKEALDSFKEAEKAKRESLREVFITTLIAVLVWWVFLFWMRPEESDVKTGFILIFFGWALITLQLHSKNEEKYMYFKKQWQDAIVFYDTYEKRIVEP